MSYNTKTLTVAANGEREFDVSFPFLASDHVHVKAGGAEVTYQWVSSSRLRLNLQVPDGTAIEIYRQTPFNKTLVDFMNGAVLTAEDLNTAVRQTLYVQQELMDLYDDGLGDAIVRLGTSQGVDVTDPTTILDQLAAIAAENRILKDFQQAIINIDLNAQSIIDQAMRLDSAQATLDALASIDGQGIQTILQNEIDQRISGDEASLTILNLIGAVSGDSKSIILNTDKVKVSPTESLATRLTGIASQLASNLAMINSESSTRATADSAEAALRQALSVKVDNNAAAILTEQTTRANADTAEANLRIALASRVTAAEAAIQTEQTTRASADSSEANLRVTLESKVDNKVTTFYQASTPTALAKGDLWYDLDDNNKCYRWSGSAWVLVSDGRFDSLTGFQASATTQLATLTTTQSAQAALFTQLGAMNGANTAFILNTGKVYVDASTSLGTRLSGIDTRLGSNEAAIVTEQNTRASAISTVSQLITSVQTTVNGHTASINTLTQSTNGLSARYGVALDVNGHITGFIQNNDGKVGSFDVVANVFRIIDPNAPGNVLVPFQYANGLIKMSNVEIDTLKVGSVTTAALAAGSVTNINFTQYAANATINTTTTPTVASVDLTVGSGSVVKIACDLWVDPNHGSLFYVDVYRDSTRLTRIDSMKLTNNYAAWSVKWIDTSPAAGTHTYSIRMAVSSGSDTSVGFIYRFIEATELKR